MNKDRIAKLGKSLEGSFFKERDQQLLQQLREQLNEEQKRNELSNATGIRDDAVLNDLLDSGIDGRALAALSLFPLVAVAWADDSMEASEREAIAKAAAEDGLTTGSPSHVILSGWMENKPGEEVLEAWKQYAAALVEELDDGQATTLRENVMGRARRVAEAAGGILGLGNKVSAAESAMLKELEQALC